MSSFFGFDPSKPPDQSHNARAPGFGPTPNAFASFDNAFDDENAETFDFDDTQDDLGARIEETGDAFNDATFGVGAVGTDFDFGAPTFAQDIKPQRADPSRPDYVKEQAKPVTGYEKYKSQPGRMPDLAPSASIWGTAPAKPDPKPQQPQQPSLAQASRKMMSLEEVEAMMRTNAKKPSPQPAAQGPSVAPPMPRENQPVSQSFSVQQPQGSQRPQPIQSEQIRSPVPEPSHVTDPSYGVPQQPGRPPVLPGQQIPLPFHGRNQSYGQRQEPQFPTQGPQILQRPPQQAHNRVMSGPREPAALHHRGPSLGGRPVTHPDQITQLSEQERAEFLQEEANRAKRNHKIHLLSKDNGLMTPQDKNFILRIQLQQLVTATGGTDEHGPEAMLAEDFYYQVYSQIRGGPGQGQLPTGNFAQAYLNQLSWRSGSRRYPRGGENHMRRMEQQVQRAVEAAKARPKNKQLVVEGSLGKISFSNAKTPKPLLNLKRPEGLDAAPPTGRARQQDTVAGRKAVLRDIEACYSSIMKMEDHERSMPQPPREESSADEIQGFMDWRQHLANLNEQLWKSLKILEPIIPRSPVPHPFIAILSHPKGKKLIPRVFRQIDDQQRVTILTMIVVQLDMLDVIRFAQPIADQDTPKTIKDEIELYAQAVEPSIFAYISDASLSIVIGLVGLITDRVNIQMVVQTKTGVNLLTRLISRAVLIMQSNHAEERDAEQWTATYNRLFDLLEPYLIVIFQTPIGSNEDFYVWQFLAALSIGANAEQQQRLVSGVRDRVNDSVAQARTLPDAESKSRLDKVNLFMHAIGLDVDLLG